jgi:hypothetical protein
MLFLAAFGQSSSAGTTASFPAMLSGGSSGVLLSLTGTISLSEARIEFEAFPQVENVTLPCRSVSAGRRSRRNKNVITIDSAGVAYRFDLYSAPQAQRFMAALAVACK